MVSRTLVITSEYGLHLRPAGQLVSESHRFESHIMLHRGEQNMNCKSLMSLLAFPVCPGDEVTVSCEGPDEEDALESICYFLSHLDQ
jgi:phosphotransferase system HPr (HPr) family protein